MREFAELYRALDESTGTLDKIAGLTQYFRAASPANAAWALHFLLGGKLSRIASGTELRALIGQVSSLQAWLIDDSYAHVGDLAETLTLLHPEPEHLSPDVGLAVWVEQRINPLKKLDAQARGACIQAHWAGLGRAQRFAYNKLLTGALRVGVSQGLAVRALAECAGLPTDTIAHRLMGGFSPTAEAFARLLDPALDLSLNHSRPYPFFLASPLENPIESLGDSSEWAAEWKWDGIRAQLIKRQGEIALWSRGEERLDGRFPELEAALLKLPDDVVLDAEILAWDEPLPAPFALLQKRIGKLKPSAKLIQSTPLRCMAYDLLELNGIDLRALSYDQRRAHLATVLAHAPATIGVSSIVKSSSWSELQVLRDGARARRVEGLILKRRSSPYQAGRKRGDWWKWKLEPLTIDAVLIYAQAGHGRRANLYTDYTFALWDAERLVPVAKAYSGLTDQEIVKLDQWIRKNTLERFGPVRSVNAYHVFELGFEAINSSTRHKSGVAVRFPRILRWRTDKTVAQANTLADLKALAQ